MNATALSPAQSSERRSAPSAIGASATRPPRRRRRARRREKPNYALAERDTTTIRTTLPLLRFYTETYHRAEVRNIERVPACGPALVVSNHSGGATAPDAPVFAVPFIDHFGLDRQLYLLTHDLPFHTPFAGTLKQWGMMPATRANARLALDAGHVVMVFPGGDYDAFRPTRDSARIDFGGRKGFIDIALETGAPIVPVVQIGAQETQLFLTRGEWLSMLSPWRASLRSNLVPITFGFPFGLTMGGMNLPLPAKITAQVLEPIDVRARFGANANRDEIYDHLTVVMQRAIDTLAGERRWPILG